MTMKLFDDSDGKPWKESLQSSKKELLLVSQFTLYAYFKGAKPDFHTSMGGDLAIDMFNQAVDQAIKLHPSGASAIKTGKFGAVMQVDIRNDGPVTIIHDYPPPGKALSAEEAQKASKAAEKAQMKKQKQMDREKNSKGKKGEKQGEKQGDKQGEKQNEKPGENQETKVETVQENLEKMSTQENKS